MKFMRKLTAFLMVLTFFFSMSTTSTIASITNFKDIPNNHWAKTEIDALVSKKIITGYSDGTFKPNQNVTRAQAAVIIGRALNVSTKNRPNPNFSDVNVKNFAYPYIAALVEEGVFAKATKFNPADTLTRSQMAKVLVESFDLQGTSSKTFSDISKTYWAKDYINTLVATGITAGTSDTTYSPNNSVTRVQMAVFIKRALDFKLGPEPVKPAVPSGNTTLMNKVVELVNIERTLAGLSPLKVDTNAQSAALVKGKDMADNNYYEHVSPTYGTHNELLDSMGAYHDTAGENLHVFHPDPAVVVKEWMESSGHRDNILNPPYTHIGVGVYEGGHYQRYYVLMLLEK